MKWNEIEWIGKGVGRDPHLRSLLSVALQYLAIQRFERRTRRTPQRIYRTSECAAVEMSVAGNTRRIRCENVSFQMRWKGRNSDHHTVGAQVRVRRLYAGLMENARFRV